MSESTVGREPIIIVQIDQPLCTREYGTAPCTAGIGTTGTTECFNTRKTCQDPDNYDQTSSVQTLSFSTPRSNLPDDTYLIPSLDKVTTSPTIINIGATGRDYKPLGVRASCTITFNDHPHSDRLVDPYRTNRSYDPLTKSSFWVKWLARNPYYKNSEIRIIEGYTDQSIAAMQTKTYILDSLSIDRNGKVTLKAKDILGLADDKQAQCPAVSEGTLIAGVTNSDTTLRVTGAVAADYPANNYVRLGDEVIYYTGVSTISGTEINLTGCTRGQYNTTAEAHDADERVQLCTYYNAQNVVDIVTDLLTTYAGISSSYIPTAEWTAEQTAWLGAYDLTTLITEPTGVTSLLGELCEQCCIYIWWDEKQQEIKLKGIHTPTDTPTDLDETKNIIADSLYMKSEPKERASQVWVMYGQKDPTKKLDDINNYVNIYVNADLNSESDNQYGEQAIRKVYARWLTNNAQVVVSASRIVEQFKDIPKYVYFDMDAKDRAVWSGDIVTVTSSVNVDFTGEQETLTCQILSAEEIESGHKVRYKARIYAFYGTPAYYMDATGTTGDAYYSDENGLLLDNSNGYTYQ